MMPRDALPANAAQGCRQCLGLPLFAGQLHSALTQDRPGQDKVAGKPMLVDKVAARVTSRRG
jgi:hypothetical protein